MPSPEEAPKSCPRKPAPDVDVEGAGAGAGVAGNVVAGGKVTVACVGALVDAGDVATGDKVAAALVGALTVAVVPTSNGAPNVVAATWVVAAAAPAVVAAAWMAAAAAPASDVVLANPLVAAPTGASKPAPPIVPWSSPVAGAPVAVASSSEPSNIGPRSCTS